MLFNRVTMSRHTDRSSDDGRIVLHDSRAETSRTRAQSSLQLSAEVTGVQSHPRIEHMFATSDSYGGVYLRDARMAFGPLKQRTNEGVVQTVSIELVCLL
jgi:WD repeat-containing protein 22